MENIFTGPTTPAPKRLVYAIGVKLMNLAESFEAPAPGSVEFKNLAATISDSFNGVLNNIPGYYKTDILGFEKYKSAFLTFAHSKISNFAERAPQQ